MMFAGAPASSGPLYRASTLAIVLPLYLVQALATAAALAATGRRRTAMGVVTGIFWNVRELPGTLRLRRAAQRTRIRSEREVLQRMHRGLQKWTLMRRFGLPAVSETGAAAPSGRRRPAIG